MNGCSLHPPPFLRAWAATPKRHHRSTPSLRGQQFYRFGTVIKIENKMNKVIHVKDDLLCITDTFWPDPVFFFFFFLLSTISWNWPALRDVLGRSPVSDVFGRLSWIIKTSCVMLSLVPLTLWCFGVHARKLPLIIIRGQCFCRGHCKLIKQICEK